MTVPVLKKKELGVAAFGRAIARMLAEYKEKL
jgi:hypothetical protein